MKNKYKFTTDWFTPAIPLFEECTKRLVGKDDVKILEIGTWEGRSATWLLENVLTGKNSKIDLVDDFGGINNIHNADLDVKGVKDRLYNNLKPFAGKYKMYEGNSHDVLRYLNQFSDQYDLIYVDGGHDAFTCLFDAVYSFSMLKKDGYLIFDDYMWNYSKLPDHLTPKIAIDSLISCLKTQMVVKYVGMKTVILRKLV